MKLLQRLRVCFRIMRGLPTSYNAGIVIDGSDERYVLRPFNKKTRWFIDECGAIVSVLHFREPLLIKDWTIENIGDPKNFIPISRSL